MTLLFLTAPLVGLAVLLGMQRVEAALFGTREG